jgi:trigger factor
MNISFDKTDNTRARLTLKIEKSDYEGKVQDAIKRYSKKAQLPGFRPGHAPASLIKKMYGAQVKAEEIDNVVSETVNKYIQENHVHIIGMPLPCDDQKPMDLEKDEEFEFMLDLALQPEFEVEVTDKDKLPYYDIEVSDKEVDDVVASIARRSGHNEETEVYEDGDIIRGEATELDENGQPKEGGIVHETSLMPRFFKSDDQKKLFDGAKKNDVITFNPTTAYDGNASELASLMSCDREEVENHKGDFSFQISTISHFVPAELNQQLFDDVYGPGVVKSEEEFRQKQRETLQNTHIADSDYKFYADAHDYLIKKVGKFEVCEELLKRYIKMNNKDITDEQIDKDFEASVEALEWQLIKNQLCEKFNVKVSHDDVKKTAGEAVRFQFMQMGIANVPEEYVENYVPKILEDKQQVEHIISRCIDEKLTAVLKEKATLDHKTISREEFTKLVG